MKNAVYGKTVENIRKEADAKLESNEKDYLKLISKPSYMSQKIFGNDLVVIRKSKVTLTLSKPAYVGICILDLSKVLMYEFHYDCIKNKHGNNSRLLFTDTDSLMYEIKQNMYMKILVGVKKCLILAIILLSQNIMMIQTNQFFGKMKDETGGVTIKEFVELKPKMYSFLVDVRSEHFYAKGVNENVVATRHRMNRKMFG